MKKSEQYRWAMRCVVESELRTDVKLEIIERLTKDKNLAEFIEEKQEEKP